MLARSKGRRVKAAGLGGVGHPASPCGGIAGCIRGGEEDRGGERGSGPAVAVRCSGKEDRGGERGLDRLWQ